MRTVQYKITDYRNKKTSDYRFLETRDTLKKCAETLGFDVGTEKKGLNGVKYFYNKKRRHRANNLLRVRKIND